jgi:hypothetical protein
VKRRAIANAAWFLAGLIVAIGLSGHAQDLGVGLDVYGISRHAQREEAKRLGVEHEVNPGVGVQLRMRGNIAEPLAGVGVYRDSGAKIARYAAAGLLLKPFGEGLGIGGLLVALHSETYNHGKSFGAPLPMISYDFGRIALNATYFPRVEGVNEIAALGLWATVWLR